MKKTSLALAAALAVAGAGTIVHADPAGPDAGQGSRAHKWDGKDRADKRMERLTQELNLTPDQQAAIRKTFDSSRDKMKALHEDFAKKRKAVMDDTNSAIESQLNADQKAKFEKMVADMKAKWKEKRAAGPDKDGDRPGPGPDDDGPAEGPNGR